MKGNIQIRALRLRRLLCFLESVRHGSFSKAADANMMKQSNISNEIKALEEDVGSKLLTRLSTGVRLTEIGHEYYKLSSELGQLCRQFETMNNAAYQLSGSIKLWATDGLGIGCISACLPIFYMNYPNVNLEINCSLDMPRLDEFDMAILFRKPTDKVLVIKSEYELKFGLFASKAYIAELGYPKNLKDLCLNHRICNRSNYGYVWKKWAGILQKAECITTLTNSSAMLLDLIQKGLGIGLLPVATAKKEKNLVRVLDSEVNLTTKFWLVVQRDALKSEKVEALLDIISRESAKL